MKVAARKTDEQIYYEAMGRACEAVRTAVQARFRHDPTVIPGEHARLVVLQVEATASGAADACRKFVQASERAAGEGAVRQAGEEIAGKLGG